MSQSDDNARSREELSARLKTAWVRQLGLELRRLMNARPPDGFPPNPGGSDPLRAKLPPVSIDLHDGGPRWGSWNPRTRVISVNARLIMGRPWDVVVGVLAHEAAHRMVTDLDPAAAVSEPDHGPAFQRACERLRLHPIYRRASIDAASSGLPPSVFADVDREIPAHPILEKIKKVLALSSSPEPHEAAAALAMASRLMARHNIESAGLDADAPGAAGGGPFLRWLFNLRRSRLKSEDFLILGILNRHFFVKAIVIWQYDSRATRVFRHVELLGRPVNLHLARHAFLFLRERVETLWLANKEALAAKGEKGLSAKNSFILQMLRGFDEKLKKSEEAARTESDAPSAEVILSRDAGLADFVGECYPRLSTKRSHSGASSPASALAGLQAGRALNIHPPVAGGGRGGPAKPGLIGWDGGK